MLQSLNRESSIKDFILQLPSESANVLGNWLIVSSVFLFSITIVISQFVPIVPKTISEYQILGWELNKWGFTFLTFVIYYFSKSLFTFIFYMSIGEEKKWNSLQFVATKFYFILSIILMLLAIALFYFNINTQLILWYLWVFLGFAFVFKLFFYSFNKNAILPSKWYYKILYICTLQIIPFVVLWKLLFI
ncbi:MAG: DUF4271 domain-containing protein [Bacteroidetes bacterium]|nr:DUF4271 domain-containing protein [Bacteroidota bacterium]